MYKYFQLLFVFFCFLSACRSRQASTLFLETCSSDSSIYVQLSGANESRSMLLTPQSGKVELAVDTNSYREAWVIYAGGAKVRYFRLDSGLWHETSPKPVRDTFPYKFPGFDMYDVDGKWQSYLSIQREKQWVGLIFSDLRGQTPDKKELTKLKEIHCPTDSLLWVYMFLCDSDSSTRQLMKRDTLRGLAFSDSLGEVSKIREHIGLARCAKRHIFLVDTLGYISRK